MDVKGHHLGLQTLLEQLHAIYYIPCWNLSEIVPCSLHEWNTILIYYIMEEIVPYM